ncbi:MAG: DUF433 domain-containing protein [Ferruginibacter sp.]|nr:DUF433 domain-containing protein [Ferruginibacter sp.]
MNWKEKLHSDPKVMFGKMVIKNTRVPVDLVLEKLGHGISYTELLAAYPKLTMEDIQACLLFAADLTKHEKTLAVA